MGIDLGIDQNRNELKGAPSATGAPSADRGDQRIFGPFSEIDLLDPGLRKWLLERGLEADLSNLLTPEILAVRAPFQAAAKKHLAAVGKIDDERKRETENKLKAQLQRYAEWSARTIRIGGVDMTNGEAQSARRKFIDNEDEYADRAVGRGHIRPDQKDRFKREMRREYELEELEGRGIITPAQRDEREALKRSSLAEARGQVIADIHQGKGISMTAGQRVQTESALRPSGASQIPVSQDLFQSTPDLQGRFATANTAKQGEPRTGASCSQSC